MIAKGLGRRHAPDERDQKYLIRDVIPKGTPPFFSRYWNANGWWGDQGETPMCVGYGWAHWLEDGPVTHKGVAPVVKPEDIYHLAQTLDEWEGEDYEGTSVRAGAKAVLEEGYIKEYRWTDKIDEAIQALLTVGPVVIGINWYDDMFEADKYGIIHVGGQIAGGHCVVVNGVSLTHELARIKNNWGREWAHDGFAYISFSDLERLINEDGEVCLAIENDIIAQVLES